MMNRNDLPPLRLLRLRQAWLAWLVFLGGLVATGVLWHVSVRLVEERTHARFQMESFQLKTAIEERLLNYEQVLAGSVGLFSVAGEVTRAKWQEYIRSVDIERYYPGIQGIGFTARVADEYLDEHITWARSQQLPDYMISPLGRRGEYYPIVFLEPDTGLNRRAHGYDASSDFENREAMERGRDTGMPTVTGKLVLAQEEFEENQASFFMYSPVYEGGVTPERLSERRALLKGFVFSVFRTNNLLDGIIGLISPFLDVRIYDAAIVSRDTLMYGSNLGTLDDTFSFQKNQHITHGGRTWLLQTRSTPAFDYLASDPRPSIVLAAGAAISLLLFAFSLLLIRSRLMAQMSAGRYRAITEGASNVTVVLDADGQSLYASPSCEGILGFAAGDIRKMVLKSIVHEEDWEQLQQGFADAKKSPGVQLPVLRARVRDVSGGWREMEGGFTAMLDVPGVNGVVLSLRDLTQLKEAQSQLHKLAFFDPLTGLPNRQLFRDRLTHVVRSSKRTGEPAALMFLDLDGFKRINDTLGHDAGDELLKHVAGWLKACLDEGDSVARLGGDEFVVLLPRIDGPTTAAEIAETIRHRLSQRIRLNEHTVGVTVSIGVTMIPDDSEDPGVLMKYADLAMYRAKESGRNNVQFFTHAMNARAARRMLQYEELISALDSDRFILHYQPKIDIATERVLGVEALLRWHHPEKGLISAQQFMNLAEESGITIRLGEIALRQACIQIQALERAGFEALNVAVNFSLRQLTDNGFLDMFRKIVTETGVSPERLELELPVELLNEEPRMVQELLGALHDIGVCLILDDFGMGACSLAVLKKLPLQAVKIDHRLIRDIPYDVSATDVASAVIALARKLHMTVIAEGVETAQQLNILKTAGCTQCQGNLISYPLSEDALIGFLVRQYERPLIS